MTQYVQENIVKIEKPITAWVLLGIIVSLAFAYALFINAAVANIVSAKDMQSKMTSLTSSVSNLESTYLSSKSSINLEYALSLGFKEAKGDIIYVASGQARSLSFNH
jgi:hypothetical protein